MNLTDEEKAIIETIEDEDTKKSVSSKFEQIRAEKNAVVEEKKKLMESSVPKNELEELKKTLNDFKTQQQQRDEDVLKMKKQSIDEKIESSLSKLSKGNEEALANLKSKLSWVNKDQFNFDTPEGVANFEAAIYSVSGIGVNSATNTTSSAASTTEGKKELKMDASLESLEAQVVYYDEKYKGQNNLYSKQARDNLNRHKLGNNIK